MICRYVIKHVSSPWFGLVKLYHPELVAAVVFRKRSEKCADLTFSTFLVLCPLQSTLCSCSPDGNRASKFYYYPFPHFIKCFLTRNNLQLWRMAKMVLNHCADIAKVGGLDAKLHSVNNIGYILAIPRSWKVVWPYSARISLKFCCFHFTTKLSLRTKKF